MPFLCMDQNCWNSCDNSQIFSLIRAVWDSLTDVPIALRMVGAIVTHIKYLMKVG